MANYDLIVLGAGISGLGVALAASEAGLTTLVIESHKPAQATSNNTLRIIHGGFRYLQKLQLARVIRSLNDQSYVFNRFPNAVKELPCLMPLSRFGLKSRIPVTAAAMMYGVTMRLAGSRLKAPYVIPQRELKKIAPQIDSIAHHGALCWSDLVISDPEGIGLQLVDDLNRKQVNLVTEATVTSVDRSNNMDLPRYSVTTESGEVFYSNGVVNTLGPWVDSIKAPQIHATRSLRWCLGFNLIINRQLHPTHAIAVESPTGRLFFAVPRGSQTAIGTWYLEAKPLALREKRVNLQAPQEEVAKFIAEWNSSFPAHSFDISSVSATDVGVLPMLRLGDKGPEPLGVEEINSEAGYCRVVSTKYTTFRSQGVAAVRIVKP